MAVGFFRRDNEAPVATVLQELDKLSQKVAQVRGFNPDETIARAETMLNRARNEIERTHGEELETGFQFRS